MLIDAFLFFEEVDLLRIRLKYLSPYVDRFVLVECDRDHSNRPHTPVFESIKDEFSAYPITHVIVRDLPDGADNWPRVWHHRNAILRGLDNVPDDAIVFTSDLDEFPDKATMLMLRTCDTADDRGSWDFLNLENWTMCLSQRFHYYMPTIVCAAGEMGYAWGGTRVTTAKTLRSLTPEGVRHRVDSWIPFAGWHFSYFGGPEAIRNKIMSIAESTVLSGGDTADLDAITYRVLECRDIYERPSEHWVKCRLDPNLPEGIEKFIWEGVK